MRARHHHIKRHKAHGGAVHRAAESAVHDDEAQDKKLIAKEIGKVMGGKSKSRLDKPPRGKDEARPFRRAAR